MNPCRVLALVMLLAATTQAQDRAAVGGHDSGSDNLAVYFISEQPTEDENVDAPAAGDDPFSDNRVEMIVPEGSDDDSPAPAEPMPYPAEDEPAELDWHDDDCGQCGLPTCVTCCPEKHCSPFHIGGWLDQGFTWNPENPANDSNLPVTFNDRANDYQFNQLYLFMEKQVGLDPTRFDAGGRVDLLYGTDFRFTTALGLETDQAPDGAIRQRWNREDRLIGLAMPQLYAEFFAPLASGLSFKFGHFYTIVGYEVVPAVENFFYSHSYTMQYGEPFTHTGMLGSLDVTDQFAFYGGLTRGWNNWEDSNNELGQLYGASWISQNCATALAFAIAIGDERPEPPPQDNNRTVYSLVLRQRLGDRLVGVLQHDLGFEDDGAADARKDAHWYSIVSYLFLTLTDTFTAGVRGEWFHDGGGARVDSFDQTADYYEFTWGLNWTPSSGLMQRTELRWDWANDGVKPFDDGTESNQVLLATDLILRY